MSAIRTVANKEMRAYFDSPVALIFLGAFLIATLLSFFGYSSFFSRNLADVRPLFAWLPILLIFLVAAITMRQWAEERKMGTLEVLLTLPVSTRDLVIGKFAAGIGLVAIGLALTLPLPVMVSLLGDLDWGPVVGGYVGALLLGATYLSIGLCVSARTDNQVVALMMTGLIASLLYLIGSDAVTQFFGSTLADGLRAMGTGARFTSIERGVVDLRDLAYYLGLSVFFLTLNWAFLEIERVDRDSPRGRTQIRGLSGLVVLVALNAAALNVWLGPVSALRLDLTEGGEYSISPVTHQTLQDLDEPLSLRGYFSERTHPLLAPLVPQIKDLLSEYAIAGDGRVHVEFADPNADEAVEQEIGERYGIRSVPFQVADRHQQAVVNSFFHVLVSYGDQFEVLSFDELIEVRMEGDALDIRLTNLEYDLTRTIKRVSRNFQNMEAIFARLPGEARLTLYVTPDTLPQDFAEIPERARAVVAELVESAAGKLRFEVVDPSGDAPLQQRLSDEFDVRPLAVDLFGRQTFYLDLVLEAGNRVQRISPRTDLPQAELRAAIEATVRRATPGQLKTLGLFTETPAAPPPNPQLPPHMQQPPPQPDFQGIEQLFGEDYRVERLDLSSGVVPESIDVLLVGKPGALDARGLFAIDQYLMRGGKLIVLAGRYAIDLSRGLNAVRHESPIFDLLATWGVGVDDAMVMDTQNASFPIPVQEQRGMFRVQRVEMLPYPLFPDIRQDGFTTDHPALIGLQNVTTPWASPLRLNATDGIEATPLLMTSSSSWLDSSGSIQPNLEAFPETGFGPSGETHPVIVAAALTGVFPSYFAERPNPLFTPQDAVGSMDEAADAAGRSLKRSLDDARLVVLGSSEIVSDLMLQLAAQTGGEVHRGDLQLVQNLIDWSTEDTDLLSIRTSGRFARTLVPLSEEQSLGWEIGCYGVIASLLGVVVLVPRQRRRSVRPLVTRETRSAQ